MHQSQSASRAPVFEARGLTKVYSTGQVSPAMQLPMAYVYAVLPLSGLIISYYCVLFMLETLLDSLAPTPDLAPSEENI